MIASMVTFCAPVAAQPSAFSFGVIARLDSASADAAWWRDMLHETDADSLAFVVANGIKAGTEPCTDKLYERRKSMLEEAKNGVILSLTASDWSDCTTSQGKSAAIDRLGRMRDMFFTDDFSFGASKIPVLRQSTTPKFRSYGENARWEIGDVIFATINIPANNNHYVTDAGRNSEFEDRLIANRDWLKRVHLSATHRKLAGIVLFCDGNPLLAPDTTGFFNRRAKRDGFAETRKLIGEMAEKYPGKVLVIHGQGTPTTTAKGINWNKNLGDLNVGSDWLKLTVNAANPNLFVVNREPVEQKNASN
ncbi:MAG: hypothetical protein H7315_03820 [Herminiimonas sp.]|nr:hypothetical protein [Herminiimonas sp.]